MRITDHASTVPQLLWVYPEGRGGLSRYSSYALLANLSGDTNEKEAAYYAHANSKNSSKPNIVYEIFSVDYINHSFATMKYGVSSREDFVLRTGNPRPEYQCLTANISRATPGIFYWYSILYRTPDRQTALGKEKELVQKYIDVYGDRPPWQIRP